MIGTDQRITSGPAARTAALRGRIHDCTRIVSRKVRFFSLAPRAPSIHDPLALTVETIGRIRRAHFLKGKTIKEIARDLKVSRKAGL